MKNQHQLKIYLESYKVGNRTEGKYTIQELIFSLKKKIKHKEVSFDPELLNNYK